MTSPRPLTLSATNFCYLSFLTLASLFLLFPGCVLIFPIIAMSLLSPTVTLPLVSLPLVFLKARYLVLLFSLFLSMIFLLCFLLTSQYCSQMTSTLSATIFLHSILIAALPGTCQPMAPEKWLDDQFVNDQVDVDSFQQTDCGWQLNTKD